MITKQALGSLLFGMADILRDKVEDYKSYILSLLFFKRLSDNYQWEIEHGKEIFEADNCREPSARELEVITKKMHDFIIPMVAFGKMCERHLLIRRTRRLIRLSEP